MDLIQKFYQKTATHNYVFGVARNGRVTAYFVPLDLNGYYTVFNEKPTVAKRQTVIKYRSTQKKIAYFESVCVRKIDFISIEELKAKCRTKISREGKPYTENCGECFEWLLSVALNCEQNKKQNLKHMNGGDLIIDGIAYQVKYEKGAITVSG